jgi:3-oxoacyl-[acyl-carrier protein] reductase
MSSTSPKGVGTSGSTSEAGVAIVAGGSRGIGAEVARELARRGMRVVIGYRIDHTAAERVAAEINEIAARAGNAAGAALIVQADVSRRDDVVRLFDVAMGAHDGVDVLVACAGAHAPVAPLCDTEDVDFDRVVGVNLCGTFYLLREAARRLRPGGRIVTFSSSALAMRVPGQAVYNACKAGVEVMTALLASELRGKNITANTIAPGPTATELFLQRAPQAAIEHLAQQTPLGRIGQPEDIARIVGFLVGSDGSWVNGQTIRGNGGLV